MTFWIVIIVSLPYFLRADAPSRHIILTETDNVLFHTVVCGNRAGGWQSFRRARPPTLSGHPPARLVNT